MIGEHRRCLRRDRSGRGILAAHDGDVAEDGDRRAAAQDGPGQHGGERRRGAFGGRPVDAGPGVADGHGPQGEGRGLGEAGACPDRRERVVVGDGDGQTRRGSPGRRRSPLCRAGVDVDGCSGSGQVGVGGQHGARGAAGDGDSQAADAGCPSGRVRGRRGLARVSLHGQRVGVEVEPSREVRAGDPLRGRERCCESVHGAAGVGHCSDIGRGGGHDRLAAGRTHSEPAEPGAQERLGALIEPRVAQGARQREVAAQRVEQIRRQQRGRRRLGVGGRAAADVDREPARGHGRHAQGCCQHVDVAVDGRRGRAIEGEARDDALRVGGALRGEIHGRVGGDLESAARHHGRVSRETSDGAAREHRHRRRSRQRQTGERGLGEDADRLRCGEDRAAGLGECTHRRAGVARAGRSLRYGLGDQAELTAAQSGVLDHDARVGLRGGHHREVALTQHDGRARSDADAAALQLQGRAGGDPVEVARPPHGSGSSVDRTGHDGHPELQCEIGEEARHHEPVTRRGHLEVETQAVDAEAAGGGVEERLDAPSAHGDAIARHRQLLGGGREDGVGVGARGGDDAVVAAAALDHDGEVIEARGQVDGDPVVALAADEDHPVEAGRRDAEVGTVDGAEDQLAGLEVEASGQHVAVAGSERGGGAVDLPGGLLGDGSLDGHLLLGLGDAVDLESDRRGLDLGGPVGRLLLHVAVVVVVVARLLGGSLRRGARSRAVALRSLRDVVRLLGLGGDGGRLRLGLLLRDGGWLGGRLGGRLRLGRGQGRGARNGHRLAGREDAGHQAGAVGEAEGVPDLVAYDRREVHARRRAVGRGAPAPAGGVAVDDDVRAAGLPEGQARQIADAGRDGGGVAAGGLPLAASRRQRGVQGALAQGGEALGRLGARRSRGGHRVAGGDRRAAIAGDGDLRRAAVIERARDRGLPAVGASRGRARLGRQRLGEGLERPLDPTVGDLLRPDGATLGPGRLEGLLVLALRCRLLPAELADLGGGQPEGRVRRRVRSSCDLLGGHLAALLLGLVGRDRGGALTRRCRLSTRESTLAPLLVAREDPGQARSGAPVRAEMHRDLGRLPKRDGCP